MRWRAARASLGPPSTCAIRGARHSWLPPSGAPSARSRFRLSGDLEEDLRRTAIQAQAILANPGFRAVLPEIVRGLLRQAEGENAISFDLVAPNMRPGGDEYRHQAASSGFRADIDPSLPSKLIVGTLLLALLVDGIPRLRRWRPGRSRSSLTA